MSDSAKLLQAQTGRIVAEIRRAFAAVPADPGPLLSALLRLLAKWRAEALKGPALRATGGVVAGGPFAGMKFAVGQTEGCFLPKLFGCYEAELHEHWQALKRERDYRTILDIGAAEGYYAVGLARLFPAARVEARDTNQTGHAILRALAEVNGVADRVTVGGLFTPADFAAYADQPVLVLCDIEGAEKDLLDPAAAPALARFDIVVEVHEGMDRGLPGLLAGRFSASHDIILVRELGRVIRFPRSFQLQDSLDRLITTWEMRSSPTPWMVMRAKTFPA